MRTDGRGRTSALIAGLALLALLATAAPAAAEGPLPTTVALTVSSPTISFAEPSTAIFRATVSPNPGLGPLWLRVQFPTYIWATGDSLGPDGSASYEVSAWQLEGGGRITVTATFPGTDGFAASTSEPVTVTVIDNRIVPTIEIVDAATRVQRSRETVITSRISPALPGGVAHVLAGSTELGSYVYLGDDATFALTARINETVNLRVCVDQTWTTQQSCSAERRVEAYDVATTTEVAISRATIYPDENALVTVKVTPFDVRGPTPHLSVYSATPMGFQQGLVPLSSDWSTGVFTYTFWPGFLGLRYPPPGHYTVYAELETPYGYTPSSATAGLDVVQDPSSVAIALAAPAIAQNEDLELDVSLSPADAVIRQMGAKIEPLEFTGTMSFCPFTSDGTGHQHLTCPTAGLYAVRHRVTIVYQSANPRVSDSEATAEFDILDTVPPVAAAPAVTLVAGSRATAPLRVRWSAQDPGGATGLRYQLETADSQTGAFTGVRLADPALARTQLAIPAGGLTALRVQAADGAGNVSSWSPTTSATARTVGERGQATTGSSTWRTTIDDGLVGGRAMTASAAGASTTFRFFGRAIALLGVRGPRQGSFAVYVDDKRLTTVSSQSARSTASLLLWAKSWDKAGEHRVRIVVAGTPGHAAVTLDGWIVLR